MTSSENQGNAQPPNARLIGIALMIAALLCFSLLDATAKWLTPRIGLIETTFVRYLSAILIITAFLNPVTKPGLMTTRAPWLQFMRSVALFAATMLNFIALQYLQLAETMTIIFLHPMIVALLAGPILGEWVGPRRLVAILIGFFGVVIAMRPGLGGMHFAAIYSLIAVFIYAAFSILTRLLARHDPPETTLTYSGFVGLIILAPMAYAVWIWPNDMLTWVMMGVVGFWGALGHWLLILAHRLAPAPILAPFLYTQLLWMVALGFFVFGDVPDRYTLIGGLIVTASGVYFLHRERVRAMENRAQDSR